MLVEMSIKNMRSIEEATFSFEKCGVEYRDQYVFRGNYLNPVTLYGDNGSGKSMALYAMKQLVLLMNYDEVLTGKESRAAPDLMDALPMLNRMVSGESPATKISFPTLSYRFISQNGLEFEYTLSCSGSTVIDETLKVASYDAEKPILVRKGGFFRLSDSEKDIEIKNTYSAVRLIGIEEYSDPKSANAIVKECFECMRKVIYIDSNERVFGHKFNSSLSVSDVLLSSKSIASQITRFSAMPEFDYSVKEDEKHERSLFISFKGGKELPIGAISDGVLRQNHLLAALYVACEDKDAVVVIDEISRSIHPLNLKKIVDEFVKKDIQLIFSCHDTNLLRYLRPDQIYFAYYKDLKSVYRRLNVLHPNIREINNIETMYLKGIFDDDFERTN